jgi:CDP-diacylglycerol pyrophosphatase
VESSFEMNSGITHGANRGKLSWHLIVFFASAIVAAICASATFPLQPADAGQRELPPNSLWEVVHNLCVPGESVFHNPKPCLRVDLKDGIERGFAILRDPRGGTQFLLVPTTRISGIESAIVRGPHAANYFADAWESRNYLGEALHQKTLARDGIGLAINSAVSRSQDQMHIHFSCIHPDTLKILRQNERKIGDQWALLKVPLMGHYYMALWVTGENLAPFNPFRLLVERWPEAARDMGSRTLVVIGLTRRDGTKGFVILSDQADKESGNKAFGEELLDNACLIATKGSKARGDLTEPETESIQSLGQATRMPISSPDRRQ